MKINYTLEGNSMGPVLILSNSLGAELTMWNGLMPYLTPSFRVLRFDTRGLGASEVTPGPYTITLLAEDVIRLMDSLDIKEAFFCGLSMGGLIGQYLGIHHGDRIKKLILSNTAASIGDVARWNERIAVVRHSGLSILADEMMNRWFTTGFRDQRPDRVHEIKKAFMQCDPEGYCSNCAAVRDADFTMQLDRINVPTMIITGDEDPVTTIEHATYLHQHIKGSALSVLKAKHLSPTELPKEYGAVLLGFLN